MSATDDVIALCASWSAAEAAGDAAALDALATAEFVLIGPVGFVVGRDQWLHRFGPEGLTIEETGWAQTQVIEHGEHAVVVIGEQHQKGQHAGQRIDGSFRTAHTFVPDGGAWRLALLQYSMLGGPPPFQPGG